MEYRAFALTIRPADGITDEQIVAVTKFILRICDYYVIITEKTDTRRHLHAGLFLKKPMMKKTINVRLRELKCFKDLSNSEKYVMNQGTRIMYNRDFIDEYMTKGDDTVVIDIEAPPDDCSEYFPPEEEQKKAMRDARVNKAKSKHLQLLEELWQEHGPEGQSATYGRCLDFLTDMIYNKRLLPNYRDFRVMKTYAQQMALYIQKATAFPEGV